MFDFGVGWMGYGECCGENRLVYLFMIEGGSYRDSLFILKGVAGYS